MMRTSFVRNLKMRLLPPSSRSFHERTDLIVAAEHDLTARLDELTRNISELRAEIDRVNGQLSWLTTKTLTIEQHDKLRFDALYRDAENNESPFESRCRFFSQLPNATGDSRLIQKTTSKLMSELDIICRRLEIPYWISYGTLIGAYTRKGFIPWDDDIDICMFRKDIEKLANLFRADERYKITTVYDRFSLCRQYRFTTKCEDNPCFIDLGAWDWAVSTSWKSELEMRQIRLRLMNDLQKNMPEYWQERPFIFDPKSGFVIQALDVSIEDQDNSRALESISQIDSIIDRYQHEAVNKKLISENETNAVAYGIDNILAVKDRKVILPKELVFPLQDMQFEDYLFSGPSHPVELLNYYFNNWPYLPSDILDHNHFSRDIIDDSVRHTLITYLEE